MDKTIYTIIITLIYCVIVGLKYIIKHKNSKKISIIDVIGSIVFAQFFLLSGIESEFLTIKQYGICEAVFLGILILYAVIFEFMRMKKENDGEL